MSAFVMDDEFFDRLAFELANRCYSRDHRLYYKTMEFLGFVVGYGNTYTYDEIEAKAVVKAQELFNANVQAVNERYRHSNELAGIVTQHSTPLRYRWTDIEFHKKLSCLHYQMAEGTVIGSEIYNQLEKYASGVAVTLLMDTPEWKQAEWGFTSQEVNGSCA